MPRHETVVTEVPYAELEKVLAKRWATRWRERNPHGIPTFDDTGILVSERFEATKEELEAGLKELVDGYRAEGMKGDVAYAATCSCGRWEANNPLPTKAAAEADADAHITAIYGEEAVANG